jgi:hypothetical protein
LLVHSSRIYHMSGVMMRPRRSLNLPWAKYRYGRVRSNPVLRR